MNNLFKGKMFSTSCFYMATDQNNSIDQDTKNNILEDLKKYDKGNNKPSFHKPGYPDFENIVDKSKSKEEFDYQVDKFKTKHSIQEELNRHNNIAESRIVEKWSVTHPDIPSEEVRAVVKENQQKDYSDKNHSEDYSNLPRKEAEWNEKLDYRALEYGANLPDRTREGIAVVAEDESIATLPGTPSVYEAPSESSNDESSEGSKQAPSPSGGQDESFSFEKTFKEDIEKAFLEDSEQAQEDEGSEDSEQAQEDESSEGSEQATFSEDETNKRPLSSYSDNNPTKKLDSKQSPLDYVLEKQATEMPDITDCDGGD